jgi:hypothetical protein
LTKNGKCGLQVGLQSPDPYFPKAATRARFHFVIPGPAAATIGRPAPSLGAIPEHAAAVGIIPNETKAAALIELAQAHQDIERDALRHPIFGFNSPDRTFTYCRVFGELPHGPRKHCTRRARLAPGKTTHWHALDSSPLKVLVSLSRANTPFAKGKPYSSGVEQIAFSVDQNLLKVFTQN